MKCICTVIVVIKVNCKHIVIWSLQNKYYMSLMLNFLIKTYVDINRYILYLDEVYMHGSLLK